MTGESEKTNPRHLENLCLEMRKRILDGGTFQGRDRSEIRDDIIAEMAVLKVPQVSIRRAIFRSLDIPLTEMMTDSDARYGMNLVPSEIREILKVADADHLRLLLCKGVNLNTSILQISNSGHGNQGIKSFILHDLGGSNFIIREGLAYDDLIWKIKDKHLLAEFLRLQVSRFPEDSSRSARLMLGVNAVERFFGLMLAGVKLPPSGMFANSIHDRVRAVTSELDSNHGKLRTIGHLGSLESYLATMKQKTQSLSCLI